MLERLNVFIGSLVLAVIVVFASLYAAIGTWTAADLGMRTASNIEQAQPLNPPQSPPPAAIQ